MNPSENMNRLLRELDHLEPLAAGPEWEQQLLARVWQLPAGPARKNGLLPFAVVAALFVLLNTVLLFRAGNAGNSDNNKAGLMDTVYNQLLIPSTASN